MATAQFGAPQADGQSESSQKATRGVSRQETEMSLFCQNASIVPPATGEHKRQQMPELSSGFHGENVIAVWSNTILKSFLQAPKSLAQNA